MIIAIPTNNNNNKDIPQKAQNSAYVKWVANAGYTPILVPMEANNEEIVAISDGLLLAGGIDIDTIYYGYSNSSSFNVDPEKDMHERKLFHMFRKQGKPVLGVCRGLQLICKEFLHITGNKYEKYIEYVENINKHTQTNDLSVNRNIPTQFVKVNIDSLYSKPTTANPEIKTMPVNSMHHQCVAINFNQLNTDFTKPFIGTAIKEAFIKPTTEPEVLRFKNFELVAWSMRGVAQPKLSDSKPDYANYWTIAEAVRIHNWGAPILATQWHPEELNDVKLIKSFFNEAHANAVLSKPYTKHLTVGETNECKTESDV